MTEKRIDYLARMIINNRVVGIGRTKSFLRAVAYEGRAEGWEEGIDEAYQEAKKVAQEWWDDLKVAPSIALDFVDLPNAWKEAIERLKERRND